MRGVIRTIQELTTLLIPILSLAGFSSAGVSIDSDAVDSSANNMACVKITTENATWYLERTGAGLSSMQDRAGADWIGFHPEKSGNDGFWRGIPNAVHQQNGSYFHPKNGGTDMSQTSVGTPSDENHVVVKAVSDNDAWHCRYDFYPTHLVWSMTRVSSGNKYWVLYEGVPGGQIGDEDWYFTSDNPQKKDISDTKDGDIGGRGPEWIAFGDSEKKRILFMAHPTNDEFPDKYYKQGSMTVFGFGRGSGTSKYLTEENEPFFIGFYDDTAHQEVAVYIEGLLATVTTAVSATSIRGSGISTATKYTPIKTGIWLSDQRNEYEGNVLNLLGRNRSSHTPCCADGLFVRQNSTRDDTKLLER
jgi:hypothetical protein